MMKGKVQHRPFPDWLIDTGIPDVEGTEFGEISPNDVKFLDAVKYANKQGGCLPRLVEIFARRVVEKGAHETGKPQWSNCVVIDNLLNRVTKFK